MQKCEITFEVIANRSYHAQRDDKFIAGPFSEIRWQQSRSISDAIGSALADVIGVDRSEIKHVIGMYEDGDRLIPSVRSSVPCFYANRIDKAQAIMQCLLQLITQRSDVSASLLDNELDENALEKVRSRAQEFLMKNGGDRVITPIDVCVGGKAVGKLQGSFAPRPAEMLSTDRSRSHQVVVIAMHVEKREVMARSLEDRKVIFFRFSDQHKIQLGESLVNDYSINVCLEETLDASGKKMLIVTDVRCLDQITSGTFALT